VQSQIQSCDEYGIVSQDSQPLILPDNLISTPLTGASCGLSNHSFDTHQKVDRCGECSTQGVGDLSNGWSDDAAHKVIDIRIDTRNKSGFRDDDKESNPQEGAGSSFPLSPPVLRVFQTLSEVLEQQHSRLTRSPMSPEARDEHFEGESGTQVVPLRWREGSAENADWQHTVSVMSSHSVINCEDPVVTPPYRSRLELGSGRHMWIGDYEQLVRSGQWTAVY
jgi:hypothetical protein